MKLKTLVALTAVMAVSSCAAFKKESEQDKANKEMIAALEKMPKHNEAEPPYPAVPSLSQILPNEVAKNRANIQSQIAQADGKTRVYFSKKADAKQNRSVVKSKSASEYYRIILGKTQQGDCAIQDFYSETDQPQNEPVVVKKSDCKKWNAQYVGNTLAFTYSKDGKMINNPVAWLNNNQAQLLVAETNQNIVLTQPVAALMAKRTILNKNKPANDPRYFVVECVFNRQNNQMEYLTAYQSNGITKRFEMTNGQINPQRILSWVPTGHKVLDSYPPERLGELQNALRGMCGLN